jgi:hypothetical protein
LHFSAPSGPFNKYRHFSKGNHGTRSSNPVDRFDKQWITLASKGVTNTRPGSRSSPQASHSPHLLHGAAALTPRSDGYFLTRIVLFRAIGFVYSVAFLVAKHQNKALIGDNGITPARQMLNAAQEEGILTQKRRGGWLNSTAAGKPKDLQTKNPIEQLRNTPAVRGLGMTINRNPTFQYWRERSWDRCDRLGWPVFSLLWLAEDRSHLNPWLDGISTWGLAMSLTVSVCTGCCESPTHVRYLGLSTISHGCRRSAAWIWMGTATCRAGLSCSLLGTSLEFEPFDCDVCALTTGHVDATLVPLSHHNRGRTHYTQE